MNLPSLKGIAAMAAEQLHEVFDANVAGVHRVTSTFMPLLQKGKAKAVINM